MHSQHFTFLSPHVFTFCFDICFTFSYLKCTCKLITNHCVLKRCCLCVGFLCLKMVPFTQGMLTLSTKGDRDIKVLRLALRLNWSRKLLCTLEWKVFIAESHYFIKREKARPGPLKLKVPGELTNLDFNQSTRHLWQNLIFEISMAKPTHFAKCMPDFSYCLQHLWMMDLRICWGAGNESKCTKQVPSIPTVETVL